MDKYGSLYCDDEDAGIDAEGLCSVTSAARYNNDIDYVGAFKLPLTLDINFANVGDLSSTPDLSEDESDLIALSRNLYWTDAFLYDDPRDLEKKQEQYLDVRSAMAVNNVAHNTIVSIAGMKARDETVTDANKSKTSGYYMINLIKELGIDQEDAEKMLGEFPSYYAQMEVLTKKIYENPDFYTHLYDKPTNVKRIGVALDAIKLMHGWDRFESALRREMLISQLVEQEIEKKVQVLDARITD